MTKQNNLKKQRTSSKQRFTWAYNMWSSLLTEVEVNQEFDDITNMWSWVQGRHDNYNKALEVEDPTNETRIGTNKKNEIVYARSISNIK